MTTIGVVCPIWQEVRFLPLVLEQLSLCPGPRLLLWQDQPLYWLGAGKAPSGFTSKVGEIAKKYPVEIIKMDHAPKDGEDAPFGGFASLAMMAFELLKKHGVEVVVWSDSDWLFDINEITELYTRITNSPPCYWATKARHYWRDFAHTMSTSDITVAYPINQSDLWRAYGEDEITRTEFICHHAAYVLTDQEMYDKINSWGHAPYFKERGFYEKEWIGKDDSLVKPQSADIKLPGDVMTRLLQHGSLDGLWGTNA